MDHFLKRLNLNKSNKKKKNVIKNKTKKNLKTQKFV